MGSKSALRTDRLLLRRWRADDLVPFADLNADIRVMEYFPDLLTREQSDALARAIDDHFDDFGYGLWAVEVRGCEPFIGFVGLSHVSFVAHFTPAVEVGWRLAHQHWGEGYATEAAKAALEFGFDQLGLAEVVSFTSEANVRSRAVMGRLGMQHDPADDFDHPAPHIGDRLRRHVLYRLENPDCRAPGS